MPPLFLEFATVFDDTLIIKPTKWKYLGKYKIKMTLTDTNNQTTYDFEVRITNSAPVFAT